jgi:tripartite-type tricarboxylate transporter receptor subunit TctC
MKFRLFSTLMMWAAGLVGGIVSAPAAQAQTEAYPSRPITMIVPAAAGGTTDLAARMISEPLSKAFGQQVVVDNRPGGNGSIATTAVARAKPDGYTLLMQYSGYHVITPAMTKQSWDPIKDFAPVANVLSAPQVIVVRPDLPIKTLSELVSYAKANPGKLNYASSGNGSLQHVTGEVLNQLAGINMTHVPYKGTAPALTDLLGGSVDLTFTTAPPLIGHIKAGKLRPLAITGNSRLPSLPDVPTASEAGFPKLDVSSWFAVYAPAATPKPIIDRLTTEIAKAMQTETFKRKAEEQGAEAAYMDPQRLAEFTRAELARWGGVVKTANIKPD